MLLWGEGREVNTYMHAYAAEDWSERRDSKFQNSENWKMNSENDDIAINTVNLVICWVNGLACGGNIERLVAHIV